MAGSSRASNSTAGSSGRVQKKTAKSSSSKASAALSGSQLGLDSVYTGTAKGVTQLPAARVKRIIKEDKDVQMVSNDAVFLISVATELFLESFTTKAFNLAKLDKRKTVSYKDLDVIPKTMTLSAALEKQRIAKEQEEMGDIEEEGDGEQDANGAAQESGDEAESEGVASSRPMSEDEGLSGAEDMDED
ncbi:hypothetical protein BGX28_000009 [Mortierella sp. GBA30]|nr:hypothetical protein BGX28_000009 [Mortierella sp. GBA30]